MPPISRGWSEISHGRPANGCDAMSTKTPMSSLRAFTLSNHCVPLFATTAVGRLAKRIWYRSLAGIKNGFLRGASPDAPTPSPATRLPQEIVNTIIAYLIHDTNSLLTCSLFSHSWYIAAVPHLHRTLIVRMDSHSRDKETKWPKSLRTASKFGSLPFVTRLIIYGNSMPWSLFSPQRFHFWTRREFSALTNVRVLYIGGLDIPSFIPTIRQYFGQFSPTVRSLTLSEPIGSDRQIVFFIGLFPHLEDLAVHDQRTYHRKASKGDSALIPPFVPLFGGQLTVSVIGGDDLATTMVDLFGSVRFHYMDLNCVNSAMQRLVYSCADTLEALDLSAANLCSKKLCSEGI